MESAIVVGTACKIRAMALLKLLGEYPDYICYAPFPYSVFRAEALVQEVKER